MAQLKEPRELTIGGDKVRDIAPLARLTKLELLELTTDADDVSPLAGLSNIEVLFLNAPRVTDLSPLAKLKNLKTLFIMDSQTLNYSPLAELKQLHTLGIYPKTQIQDVSPICGLFGLRDLFFCPLSDECFLTLQKNLPMCDIRR